MSDKKSYQLSDELVDLLENEFQIKPLVDEYKDAVKGLGQGSREELDKKVFGAFGRGLADRICAIESNYRDASADLIYKIAEQTGHPFPSIQQRLIEISLLATMNANRTRFHEVSFKRLSYEVSKCVVYETLQQNIDKETADQVPCRYLCLSLNNGICENTAVAEMVTVNMPTKISDENGCCIFSTELKLEEQLKLS